MNLHNQLFILKKNKKKLWGEQLPPITTKKGSEKMKRDQKILICLSVKEKQKLEKKAELLNLSVSAFIRYKCLR